ncbi:MAG TPA: PspC domain-containing protein, partial [Acidimicrobiia bacterium]|nr:PspC domain-containing protein [Acidimicrobiia bacterium]
RGGYRGHPGAVPGPWGDSCGLVPIRTPVRQCDHHGVSFERQRLVRRHDGRIVAGVAAGLGDSIGVDANVVRCALLVLALAGGLGFLVYGVGWLVLPTVERDVSPPRRSDAVSTVAFAAIVLGVLLLVRAVAPWPGDVIVWPLGAAMVGLAVLATRPRDHAPEPPDWAFLDRLPPDAADAVAVLFGTRRGALARIVAGIACIAAGLGAFFATADSWRALQGAVIGASVVLVGFALIVGPGVWELIHQLVGERRERIRSDERAEVAAHLHDSVLQTLALVQRRADNPREVVRLARMQERELRHWLLGRGNAADDVEGSLGAALDDVAADVEAEHGVPVEVVRVRDCPAVGMQPLLLAAREAIVNAVRHSGAATVSVYLEVEGQRVSIFVRDRGRGFDPTAIADDRRGISGSIVDRLDRAGGRGEVRTTPGEGTEVEMSLPRATESAAP